MMWRKGEGNLDPRGGKMGSELLPGSWEPGAVSLGLCMGLKCSPGGYKVPRRRISRPTQWPDGPAVGCND
jgi:hypothetical protein